MKKQYAFFFLFFVAVSFAFGQNKSALTNNKTASKWTLNEPFEQKVFIENSGGQLDGKIPAEKGKILYSTRITGVDVYFTANGIIYRYDKFPPPDSDDIDKVEQEKKPEANFFSIQWENTNPNVELVAENEVSFYYCYAQGNKHTVFAHAFKKIEYKNIYPGIDVEYSFPEKDKGLEYSIIVRPHADLSVVKLIYDDVKSITQNANGDILSESAFGNFIDHAPTKTYYAENNNSVACQFKAKANEITFHANYDKNKTLVIDPWIVNPLFSGYDAGYDIAYDLKGNVYVYGGFNPYQEVKIDSSGVVQWYFNAVYSAHYPQFGGFAVDQASGTSYLGDATYPTILKVNTLGTRVDTFHIGINMEELWKMAYNPCVGQLIIGGGGTADPHQVCLLDTSLTLLKPYDILHADEVQHDIASLAIDTRSTSIYLAIMESNKFSDYNNVLVNCSLPSMTTNYVVSDNFSFYEGPPGLSYIDGVNELSNSPNGAVIGYKYAYLYDGATLRRYNKTTGGLLLSKTISPTKMHWSGIDMDLCENLYLADSTNINTYDTGLNNTGFINAGNNIYGLRVTPNNQLIACGKQFISSFILHNPISITVITHQGNNCSGGTATASLNTCTQDSSQYAYLWSTGATTHSVTGLAIGNYTVTISPRCDFNIVDTFSITSGRGNVSVSTTHQNIPCYGGNTGAATAIASHGSSPYTYLWSPGGSSTVTISGLSAGSYSITVTDSCGNSATNSAIITQPNALSISTNITHTVSCNGGSNGSATATISGGTTPYTYLWSNSQTTSTISTLSAGTYSLNVTDSCGGSATASVTITQPNVLTVSANTTANISCHGGNNGSVLSAVSGGITPYTYLWSDSKTTANISSLTAGTYTLNVTDHNGCTATASATITQPNILTAIANIAANVSCNGGSNGSVSSSVSGGTTPYTYSWSGGGGTNSTASGLTIGTYTLNVTDHNGCTATASIAITQPTILNVSIHANNVNCNGGINGSATATASGGTPSYTYTWSGGGGTNSTASGLSAGTYTVFVQDSCGALARASVTITQPGFFTASTTINANIICHGGNNGSATVIATGGTSPYTYLWTPSGQSTSTATGLSALIYSILVTDSYGCTTSTNVSITQPLALRITPSVLSNITCNGNNTGSITAAVGGGTSPYLYLWSGGRGTTLTISNLSAGTYTLTVTDYNGCTGTTSASITQPDTLSVSAHAIGVSCYGENSGSASSTVSGGTLPYTYSWSNGQSTANATHLIARTYTLTVQDSCGDVVLTHVTITQPPAISITENSIPDPGNCIGSAWVTVSGGTPAYTYLWSPGGNTTDSVYHKCPGSYCCTVTDAHGCTDSVCINIKTTAGIDNITSGSGQINVYPNPNNGQFTIEASGISGKLFVEIYNVLGQEIKNEELRENTTVINLDNQPNGIYFYRVLKEDGDLMGEGKIIISR